MGENERIRGRLVAIAVATVLIAAGCRSAGGQEVIFEKATDEGSAPFTEPAVVRAPKSDFQVAPSKQDGSDSKTPFGGSGKINVCDRAKLIKFLNAHPAEKRAWTKILGIRFQDFEKYVKTLRPVVLQQDTRVTNHGFKNGKAFALQSILAAGTAVLAEPDGDIVVKCYCGNPLTPAKDIERAQCTGCPPNYDPPPPCEDCYECPDERGCPIWEEEWAFSISTWESWAFSVDWYEEAWSEEDLAELEELAPEPEYEEDAEAVDEESSDDGSAVDEDQTDGSDETFDSDEGSITDEQPDVEEPSDEEPSFEEDPAPDEPAPEEEPVDEEPSFEE